MSHWYRLGPNGPERYIQLKKDGTPRQNIDRGRALADGAVESVTTLLRMIGDSGGLIYWSANHGIEAGLDVGMSAAANMEPRDALIALAKADWKERTERAANEGTALHDSIEHRLVDWAVAEDLIQRTAQDEVEAWVTSMNMENQRAEHCLLYRGTVNGVKLAFGGTTDLITTFAVVDFKTVEPDARGNYRKPKPSEAAQLAAYRLAGATMGLCEAESDCWNLYVCRQTGRLVKAHKWTEAMLKHGLTLLCCAATVSDLYDKIEASVERSMK